MPPQHLQEDSVGAVPVGAGRGRGAVRARLLRGGRRQRPLPRLLLEAAGRRDAAEELHAAEAAGPAGGSAGSRPGEGRRAALEQRRRHPAGAQSEHGAQEVTDEDVLRPELCFTILSTFSIIFIIFFAKF